VQNKKEHDVMIKRFQKKAFLGAGMLVLAACVPFDGARAKSPLGGGPNMYGCKAVDGGTVGPVIDDVVISCSNACGNKAGYSYKNHVYEINKRGNWKVTCGCWYRIDHECTEDWLKSQKNPENW
jgi:hypothetical protein